MLPGPKTRRAPLSSARIDVSREGGATSGHSASAIVSRLTA